MGRGGVVVGRGGVGGGEGTGGCGWVGLCAIMILMVSSLKKKKT